MSNPPSLIVPSPRGRTLVTPIVRPIVPAPPVTPIVPVRSPTVPISVPVTIPIITVPPVRNPPVPVRSPIIPISPVRPIVPAPPTRTTIIPVPPTRTTIIPVPPTRTTIIPVPPTRTAIIPVPPTRTTIIPASPVRTATIPASPVRTAIVPVPRTVPYKAPTVLVLPRTVAFPPTRIPTMAPEKPYVKPTLGVTLVPDVPAIPHMIHKTDVIPIPPIQLRPIANIQNIPLNPAEFPTGPAGFQHLPVDVLVKLLAHIPPNQIAVWCTTNAQIRAICQNETFMLEMIREFYRVSPDKIPGMNLTEKYGFISLFDSRYFTDPNFVRVSANYLDLFGPDYTSRKNPNDALETIISIWRDSAIVDLSPLVGFKPFILKNGVTETRSGAFNHNFVTLLCGAIMTKCEAFASAILDILIRRLRSGNEKYFNQYLEYTYSQNFRYPFILSIEYGMDDITKELRGYYNPYGERVNAGITYEKEIAFETDGIDSDEILDRFLPYIDINDRVYWLVYYDGTYAFADRILNELRKQGKNPFDNGRGQRALAFARQFNQQANIDYLMKHIDLF